MSSLLSISLGLPSPFVVSRVSSHETSETADPALFPGIALFTYHKYRKSIDSKVPLDAHGNPINDEGIGAEDAHHLHVIADEERRPLATSMEQQEQVSRAFVC